MGLSAFQSDVGCRDYVVQPDKILEAQAGELQSVKFLSVTEGSWSQKYIGKNCGNSTQNFYAKRTIPVNGKASSVIGELRSELTDQGYNLTGENYVIIRDDTCTGRYLADIRLKNGGEAVITLTGRLDSAACSHKSAQLTEEDFSNTLLTVFEADLSTR